MPPMISSTDPGINGAINETAFRVCREGWSRPGRQLSIDSTEGGRIWDDVCSWLGERPEGKYDFSHKVWLDVHLIASNIYQFLLDNVLFDAQFDPLFRGCGILSECRGDILADDLLIEVKAGDRGFRAVDLRQILVYSALAREAGDVRIKRICLMNPRWGVSWSATLDDAATSCGASSSAELLEEICRGATSLDVSG